MSANGILSVRQRLSYGVGDLGINFYFGMATTYLLYFYTDVYGIAPAIAGSVLLIARVIDAIAYPVMGLIADRTRSRWGRFRPYLLFGPLPLALLTIGLFTTPQFSAAGKIWWAYGSYIAFGIAYTIVAVPYAAMTPTLTADYRERTTLSSVRMFCAFAGAWIISVYTPQFVAYFSSPAIGYEVVAAAYASVATLLLWLCFANTRELIDVPQEAVSMRASFGALIGAMRGNAPLIVVILVFLCGLMSFTIRTTAAIYYFKYNLARPDLIGVYFGWTIGVMVVGLLFVPRLAARFDKAGAVIIGAALTIIGGIGLYFTPYAQPLTVLFWCCVMAFGGSPVAVMGWSMTADAVDFAEWQTGVRADGVILASATFFQQLAGAFAGAGAAATLAWFGYVANAAQSAASLDAICALMTLAPIAIMIVLIVACTFYRLDAQTHGRIRAELLERSL